MILSAIICPDGKVHDVVVLEGIPWAPLLDEAAARAVRSWTYRPALDNDKPVPVYMTVGIDFNVSPHPTTWARSVVNLKLDTTLDRALAKLEKVGFKIKYTGSSPPVFRTYEEDSVQAILYDLADRYRLTMELVSPGKLRITGLPGPETEGLKAPVLESRGDAVLPEGSHGRVGLNLVVLDDGTVDRATVVHPSGSDLFDEVAIKTARKWRFRPATLDGKAVAAYLPVIVEQ